MTHYQIDYNTEISIGNLYSFNIYNLIGKGAFGDVYEGKNNLTNERVAFKIESKISKESFLLNEFKIYKNLQGGKGIPKIYYFEINYHYNALIMQKLGPTLEYLFHRCNKRFSLETTLKIGKIILSRLEFIHGRNIIHRDIKPDCFLLGQNSESSTIYIIDFGLSKFYKENNKHIPFAKNKNLVGNIMYSSISSLQGIEKSRRDDIESLGYILVYFLKGYLPRNIENNGFIYANSKMLENDFIKRKSLKMSISLDELCKGLPNNIKLFISYARNLKFDEKPNYLYLRNLLDYSTNSDLDEYDFDWIIKYREQLFNQTFFKNLNNKDFENISNNSDLLVQKDDRDIIEEKYIGNPNSFRINSILRKEGVKGLNKSDKELYDTLNRVIRLQKTSEDYNAYRYVGKQYLIDELKIIPSNDLNYTINEIIKIKGITKIEKGFMSCAITNNHIIEHPFRLEIKIPKGIYAYITKNIKESEIILLNNTKYQILGSKLGYNNIIIIYIGILN